MLINKNEIDFQISSMCDPEKGCAPCCVGVSYTNGEVLVTNTTTKDGVMAKFTPAEWTAFIAGVKKGEFDI